jgi:hypothetical protein
LERSPANFASGALKERSAIISIDIDDIKDLQSIKGKLSEDDFVYAVFYAASGRGLCAYCKN